MERRLAAIVAADVVGYSRMIRADEDGTIAALRALRAELIDPAIARHRGRIVKLMGDGVLVEYASVVDAVASAVEVQQGAAARNADVPEQKRIVFRIGVNLGDVVIDGDDIQGDGVNLAARLEALAEPGAVCVADAVHEQVRDRLGLVFTDLGEREVKNIDRPVRAWQWGGTAAPAAPKPAEGPPLPDRPSVAVLPFDNMSGDPEQAFFADGIAEDVITALSRNGSIFVIARNSSFTYRGKSVDMRQVGRELGVRYVLEGSVRRGGNRVRITAQLIEAETGSHVWAERYDRPLDDIFEVQDEITANVAGAVGSEIHQSETRRAARQSGDLPAWEVALKAHWLQREVKPEPIAESLEICRRGIAQFGETSQLCAALALAHGYRVLYGWHDAPRDEVLREGMATAETAIRLDPNNDIAHWAISFLCWLSGDSDAQLRHARTAIGINPNSLLGHLQVGLALGWSGVENGAEARKHLEMALRLGPRDFAVFWVRGNLGMVELLADDFDAAIDHARKALEVNPDAGIAHRVLTSALAHAGRVEEAKAAWRRSLEVQPIDLPAYAATIRRAFRNAEDAEKFFAGLRLAGAGIE